MKTPVKRLLSFLLCLALLAGLAGCAKTPAAPVNGPALFATILDRVTFETPLENAGENTGLYFTDIPESAELVLYVGSGYYADEAVLVTVTQESDAAAAEAMLRQHLQQRRDQFANYLPEEVGKIDDAVLWQQGNVLILCITKDLDTLNAILKNPSDPAYTTAPTETTTTAPETEPSTAPETTPTTAPVTEPSTAPVTEPPTVPPTEAVTEPVTPPTEPVPPEPTYDLTNVHYYGSPYRNGTIRVGNRAYENYVYLENSVNNYTALINKAAEQLGDGIHIYHLLIPTAIGIILPEETIPHYPEYVDQGVAINNIFSLVSDRVIKVNCYENLRAHRDEYLYFRTDYHWNGPAAYYAYETFCQAKGITPYTMAQRPEYRFEKFLGALYWLSTDEDPVIGANPDTVIAYGPACSDVSMTITDKNGDTFGWPVIVNVDGWGSGTKYNCFAGADNPFTVFKNPAVTDGSACIVVKESFGNALMSYIADHYSTVYEIDYRYWEGNLAEFAKANGVTDVIFANNMSMTRNDMLIGMLGEILD